MMCARFILFLFLLSCIGWPCLGHAQELVSNHWVIGAWTPGAGGIWPAVLQTNDTNNRELDVQGFGAVQYSPGALLRGAFWDWPSSGGVGWQLVFFFDWSNYVIYTHGYAEHWRIAGVSVDDWNEAWQWGTWDGMGWAWNPTEADIALARTVGTVGYSLGPSLVIEAGNRRHHWGKGWRSLWLDRQAAPLPFARIVLNTERISRHRSGNRSRLDRHLIRRRYLVGNRQRLHFAV